MAELQDKILSMVQVANGKMLYPDLLASIDPIERQHLRRALVGLRDAGRITQVITWDAVNSVNTHTIEIPTG